MRATLLMSARVYGERRRPDRKAASQLGLASLRRHEKSTRHPSRAMLLVTRLASWQRYRDKNTQDRNRRSAPRRLACRTPSHTTEVPPKDTRVLAAPTVACRTLPAGARSQWPVLVADEAHRRTWRHPVPRSSAHASESVLGSMLHSGQQAVDKTVHLQSRVKLLPTQKSVVQAPSFTTAACLRLRLRLTWS